MHPSENVFKLHSAFSSADSLQPTPTRPEIIAPSPLPTLPPHRNHAPIISPEVQHHPHSSFHLSKSSSSSTLALPPGNHVSGITPPSLLQLHPPLPSLTDLQPMRSPNGLASNFVVVTPHRLKMVTLSMNPRPLQKFCMRHCLK